MTRKEINDLIRKKQKEKHISNGEMSKRLGVHRVTYGSKLSGDNDWKLYELLFVCKTLGLELVIREAA